ncbi:MAG: hypothetical protein RL161_360 [Bacteroidota bacterium]
MVDTWSEKEFTDYMKQFKLDELTGQQKQALMQSVVGPRPICFASTVNTKGEVNLSPFSFFNMFSIDPPVCVFSPSRRLRDGTTKHTLENIKETMEVVINVVNYSMVYQTSLASCEYPQGINEFIKAGFTMVPSEVVRPPRVAESPVQMECTVRQIIAIDEKPGSGNLVIADVKRIHVSESVFDDQGRVDPNRLDLVARMGGDWYARITPESLFEVPKPNVKLGIGMDKLPLLIQETPLLSSNEKAALANIETLQVPEEGFLDQFPALKEMVVRGLNPNELILAMMRYSLEKKDVITAWKLASFIKES